LLRFARNDVFFDISVKHLASQHPVAAPRQTRRYAAPVPRARGTSASPVRPSSLSRIERDRVVNQVLATELAGRVHALSLATQTPEESDR
jgi:hypothetical protein